MKVLQLCKFYAPYKGGIELVETMISKSYRESESHVTILCFGKKNKKFYGEFGEEVIQLKADVHFLSTPYHFNINKKCTKMLDFSSFDIIYAHLPNPIMHELLKYLCRSKIILKKVIGIYHADILNKGILGNLYNSYFSQTSSLYTSFVTSSANLISSSTILSSIDQNRIKVVPFCTSGNLTFNEKKMFNDNIVAIGRLVPYKGFEFLINTLNKTNYKLTIIGDGPLKNKLLKIKNKNISILSNLNDEQKNKIIRESSCMVLSSLTNAEAFGLVIAEAFEAGLPVISSDLKTGVTYMVRNDETGFTFKAGDGQELLDAIDKLKSDSTKYNNISKQCRIFYENNLSYSKFKKNILELT